LIVKNYRELKRKPDTDALCLEDFMSIKMWKWNASITVDMEQHLTSRGKGVGRERGKREREKVKREGSHQ